MRLCLAVPGDLSAPTGGYAYAREILAHLPAHGVAATHLALPGGFPAPGPTISPVPRSSWRRYRPGRASSSTASPTGRCRRI